MCGLHTLGSRDFGFRNGLSPVLLFCNSFFNSYCYACVAELESGFDMANFNEKFSYLNEKIGRFFGYALFLIAVSFVLLLVIVSILPAVLWGWVENYFGLVGIERLYILIPLVCIFVVFSLVSMWRTGATENVVNGIIKIIGGILKFVFVAFVGLYILWVMLIGGVTDIINIFKSPQPAEMFDVAISFLKIIFAIPVAWVVTFFLENG